MANALTFPNSGLDKTSLSEQFAHNHWPAKKWTTLAVGTVGVKHFKASSRVCLQQILPDHGEPFKTTDAYALGHLPIQALKMMKFCPGGRGYSPGFAQFVRPLGENICFFGVTFSAVTV